jgi:hypothetical protein
MSDEIWKLRGQLDDDNWFESLHIDDLEEMKEFIKQCANSRKTK